jgi:acetolactate synthase-1/2/3 large subunit
MVARADRSPSSYSLSRRRGAPIYDEIFQQSEVGHPGQHEQGASHAAEGYSRSTGTGVVLGSAGATNMVTPLTDALMDSIPLVCITGRVPTHLIGNDAVPGMRHRRHPGCTKHNWLVRDATTRQSAAQAFYVASTGRPARWWSTPKDAVRGRHLSGRRKSDVHVSYAPRVKGDAARSARPWRCCPPSAR